MKKFIRGFQRFIPVEGGATFKQAMHALPWFLTAQAKGGQALLTNAASPKKKSQRTCRSTKERKPTNKAPVDKILEEL
jgi:hypothetical protein